MKPFDLECIFIKSAPLDSPVDNTFTHRVMEHILSPSLKDVANSSTSLPKKHSVLFRLRHLPKFAAILLALTFLLTVSSITYAVVQTIKQQSQVNLETSGINEHGRQQFNVMFNSCAEQEKNGITYELKKDSGLSAEDGVKVLRAQCERDSVVTWLQKNSKLATPEITTNPNSFQGRLRTDGFIGTLRAVTKDDMSIHSTNAFGIDSQNQTLPFPQNTRVVENNKIVDKATLEPGKTILYFSPRDYTKEMRTDFTDVTVFKLNLDAKYYSQDMQAYVRARQPCENNAVRSCIVSNHINTVMLEVDHGGLYAGVASELPNKTVQGKVVSWNDYEIKLDVGGGLIYTFQTNRNVIDIYNQSTVYGLKSYDSVYSKTDSEDLKITTGDSLEIHYQESVNESAQTLSWTKIFSFQLMVERKTDNLDVLHKY